MVAIDLITEHIRMKLQQPELRRIYVNLEVIPSNYQIRGMHTIIRDASTSKADFVFYADRLLRLVRPAAHARLMQAVRLARQPGAQESLQRAGTLPGHEGGCWAAQFISERG